MSALAGVVNAWDGLNARLRGIGEIVPRGVLRLIMGWEFWESGLEKLRGENWFADIQAKFPWPFDVVPAHVSWSIATWFELIGGLMLWIGLGTRFFAFSLLFLTFVATAAVHWPDMWTMWSDLLKGYAITDAGHGNFKLPLLFVVMLLPLIFNGPGKFSVDWLIARAVGASTYPRPVADAYAWAIAAAIFGVPFLMLVPAFGFVLVVAAIALALVGRYVRD